MKVQQAAETRTVSLVVDLTDRELEGLRKQIKSLDSQDHPDTIELVRNILEAAGVELWQL